MGHTLTHTTSGKMNALKFCIRKPLNLGPLELMVSDDRRRGLHLLALPACSLRAVHTLLELLLVLEGHITAMRQDHCDVLGHVIRAAKVIDDVTVVGL